MTIDVHGHLSPPESVRRYPMPRQLGDATGMIESKLELGISMTIIGSPVGAGAMVPLPGVDNYAQTEDELHGFHDWQATLIDSHRQHLRGYVYVNPFGGSAHLANAADRARWPEFVGFIANTSVSGRYLHDPAADEFFGMVSELDLPVFLHAPAVPAAGAGLTELPLIEQLGRFSDITIGVACCVLGGWFARYPRLRVLASTGAGALALLAEKLDQAWAPAHWGASPATGVATRPPEGPPGSPPGGRSGGPPGSPPGGPASGLLAQLPQPPSSYLDRVWMDTATPSPAAIALGLQTFGPSQVLFGTDSPPLPTGSAGALLKTIAQLPVDESTREAVLAGNARQLFGERLTAAGPAHPAGTAVGSTAAGSSTVTKEW